MKTTIGVDLHKHQLNTVVLDERGAVKERRELSTKCRRQIAEYFGSYGREAEVAVESVGFYQWFWDLGIGWACGAACREKLEHRRRTVSN